MPWAEFEEKEYEAPLYNQMEAGHPNVWSPGQVFEHRIGIDHGMLVINPRFWRHIGFSAILRGSVLSRYDFQFLPRPLRRSLPDFRMNVFVQAKRCERLQRVRRDIQHEGIDSPCYRITLDPEQRDVLSAVAGSLGYHSYVCYAAPAFHTLSQLYRHTRLGSVINQSTFPSASSLSGHDAWYYNGPGASGDANPEPEYIEGSGLIEKIQEMAQASAHTEGSTSENLQVLAKLIIHGVERTTVSEGPRRAAFFDELRLIDREVESIEIIRDDVRSFLQIDQFARTFDVEWYTLS